MEVILFRQSSSVTTTSKMNSKAIINKNITPKIASDCRTLFDLFFRFLHAAEKLGYGTGHYTFIYMTPMFTLDFAKFNDDKYLAENDVQNAKQMLKFVLSVKVMLY